jgi:hypothetical protein
MEIGWGLVVLDLEDRHSHSNLSSDEVHDLDGVGRRYLWGYFTKDYQNSHRHPDPAADPDDLKAHVPTDCLGHSGRINFYQGKICKPTFGCCSW